jgi:hypothetical protein
MGQTVVEMGMVSVTKMVEPAPLVQPSVPLPQSVTVRIEVVKMVEVVRLSGGRELEAVMTAEDPGVVASAVPVVTTVETGMVSVTTAVPFPGQFVTSEPQLVMVRMVVVKMVEVTSPTGGPVMEPCSPPPLEVDPMGFAEDSYEVGVATGVDTIDETKDEGITVVE